MGVGFVEGLTVKESIFEVQRPCCVPVLRFLLFHLGTIIGKVFPRVYRVSASSGVGHWSVLQRDISVKRALVSKAGRIGRRDGLGREYRWRGDGVQCWW